MDKKFETAVNRENSLERKSDKKYLSNNYPVSLDKKIINSSIADLNFETPYEICEAIKKRANIRSFSYTYISDDSLSAIQSWYKNEHKSDINLTEIKLVHGTVNAMYQIVQSFTNVGDSILIQTPIYEPFARCILHNDRKIVENKLIFENNTYKIDFKKLEASIKENNIKLFLFCNPHNPGGKNWNNEDLKEIIDICLRNNVILFSDEVHSDLDYSNNFTTLLKYKEIHKLLIIANSPNKPFNLGGLKGSYLVIKNPNLKKIIDQNYEKNSLTSPNVFLQPAIIEAYTNPNVKKWLDDLKDIMKSNFEFFKSETSEMKFEIFESESSYLPWIKFNYEITDEEFKQACFKENLIFNFYDNFYGAERKWFRLNTGCPREEIELTIKILKNIFEK
ncbi:aminotransferase class I/II-fold pyridoxal phosphate-dependent enzyme [Mesoplasma photuris]|uniref:aminotransferase class I/II-fold pyridoxal phosphate-dependent enzyme n=1 Tax=Mesoplasma photuris TaxID=217731 RepID=UPI0004E282D1|nr:aminotransferase class I/II-fold pyridoxal phosphate-dependent enzyme [Mesoplasma photuris]